MAEKKAQQSESAPAGEAPPKKGKLKMLIVVAAIMAVEGVGVFYVTNMLSASPEAVSASTGDGLTDEHDATTEDVTASTGHAEASVQKSKDDHGATGHDAHKGSDAHANTKGGAPSATGPSTSLSPTDGMMEIEVADSRLHNVRSGRSMIVRIKVSVLVMSQKADQMKSMIEQRKARLHERVCSVVRNAEPKLLDEPGLETLKRQLKFELTQVVGDSELIREVLIPELLHD
jgi:flagellar basal body-associated protein FliL